MSCLASSPAPRPNRRDATRGPHQRMYLPRLGSQTAVFSVSILSRVLPRWSFSTSRSKRVWRLSQKRSVVPKYRASRSAVSAVTRRLPWTISLIRRGGTPIATASRFWLTWSGSRNSAIRISQADPPLLVDADAVLSSPVPAECFQSVAGRHSEVVQRFGGIQHHQLPQGCSFDTWVDALDSLP